VSQDLQQLREANEAARLERETMLLRAESAALSAAAFPGMHVDEAQPMREAWGEMVPQTDYPRGDWDRQQGYNSLLWSTVGAQIGDRARGAEQLVFENEVDLARIRAIGRLLGNSSANAQAILNNLTSYILGTGYAYKAVAEEGETPAEDLLQTVQQIIGEVRRENRWWQREDDLFQRAHRDGEYFVGCYHVGAGHTQLRILEPEQFIEPDDPDRLISELGFGDRPMDWSFGVLTDELDLQNVFGYWCHWRTPQGRDEGRFFPRQNVVHCRRNVDENIKRGVSDFYAVYEQLLDAGKLLRNTTKGHAILAAIAFIREHAEGVTQSQVESMRSSNAWSRYSQNTGTEGNRTRYVHYYQPGTIVDTGHDTKYKPSPMAEQGVGQAMVTVEESVLRIAGSKWSMPSYMVTGNLTESAYSSTLAAESPFTKYCERQQIKHGNEFADVLWAALRIAYAAGRFDQHRVSFEDLRRQVKIEVKQPIVPGRDRNIETNRHKILRDSGIISDETWAAEEGYDLELEKSRGAEEHKSESPFGGGDQPGVSTQADKPDKGKAEGSLRFRESLDEAAALLWGNYPGIDSEQDAAKESPQAGTQDTA
jgi:hypothetical protein